MGLVVLNPGREKPVLLRHPWIFSGAVAKVTDAAPGDIVKVEAADGRFLAWGYYNPDSQIRVRLLSWQAEDEINRDFWKRRLTASLARRDAMVVPPGTNAVRLVHAESDLLPGLIVDRYDRFLVVQALTRAMDQRKQEIAELLMELAHPAGVYERSDEDVRGEEGLAPAAGVLAGETPPVPLAIEEGGLKFLVDVTAGHKTGFYLDQRDNRLLVRQLATGRRVLNAFAYTGAFTVAAIAGGAGPTLTLESSAAALALATENLKLNGFADRTVDDELGEGNCFSLLRQLRAEERQFDLVVLDPPKFAPHARQVQAASRGYKDINLLALQLLAPGGLLLTFSCSGAISPDLFQKIVFGAAADIGAQVQIVRVLTQAPDHPVLLSYPESAYLKGLLLRVLGND